MSKDSRIVGKTSFLDRYPEIMGGGEDDMFWCALDRDKRPSPKSLVGYRCPPDCDPCYGDAFNWPTGGRHIDIYRVGYARFAAWTSNVTDWSHSGNVQDGPVFAPATSQDVILADIVMSEGCPSSCINNHATDPRDNETHQENNVAYSDGHVETHVKTFTEFGPPAHWQEHYVRYTTSPCASFWLY